MEAWSDSKSAAARSLHDCHAVGQLPGRRIRRVELRHEVRVVSSVPRPALRKSTNNSRLALGSATAPRERLRDHGWHLVDPLAVTRDPWTYQRYIEKSKAEFSVAKHGYVVSRCGWFSERSACYLAAGRPVVVQDTGFSDRLPTGRRAFELYRR